MPDIFVSQDPVIGTPSSKTDEKSPVWLRWVIVIGLVLYALHRFNPDISPIPQPTPYEPGDARVMFVLDDEQGISREQGQVAISQLIQKACDDLDVEYRRYDVRDDLSKEEPKWQEMMDSSKAEAPSMTTVSDSGAGEIREIPSSVDDAISIIRGLK